MKVIGAGLPRTALTTQKLAREDPAQQGVIGGAVTSVQQGWDREQAAVA